MPSWVARNHTNLYQLQSRAMFARVRHNLWWAWMNSTCVHRNKLSMVHPVHIDSRHSMDCPFQCSSYWLICRRSLVVVVAVGSCYKGQLNSDLRSKSWNCGVLFCHSFMIKYRGEGKNIKQKESQVRFKVIISFPSLNLLQLSDIKRAYSCAVANKTQPYSGICQSARWDCL